VRPVVVSGLSEPQPLYVKGAAGELTTTRLRIRPLAESDRTAYIAAACLSRSAVEHHMPIYEPGESDDAMFARQLAAFREGEAKGHAWRRLIELREPGTSNPIAGVINLNSIQRGMSFEADVALWIRADLQARGLGLEALRAVIAFATADLPEGLGLHRIHGGIAPANVNSAKAAIRAGFKRDGNKQSMLRVGDRWERHDYYVFDPLV